MHMSGALVTFTCGVVVAGLQAWLTRLMHPEVVEMGIFWMRTTVAVVGIFFYIIGVISASISHIEDTGTQHAIR